MSEAEIKTGGSARVFGFFTVLLILTLDASNGSDLIDVVIPYIESLTQLNYYGK